MTKKELMEALKAAGIDFNKKASVKELAALLQTAENAQQSAENSAEQTAEQNSTEQSANSAQSAENTQTEQNADSAEQSAENAEQSAQTADSTADSRQQTAPKCSTYENIEHLFTSTEKHIACYVKESECCVTVKHEKSRLVRMYVRKKSIRLSMTKSVYVSLCKILGAESATVLTNKNYRSKEKNMPFYCDIVPAQFETLKNAITAVC